MLSLHVIACARDEEDSQSHAVLAVHKSGLLSCYSLKLTSHLWSRSLSSPTFHPEKSINVHFATTLSKRAATKSILKRREDILDVPESPDESQVVLSVVSDVSSNDGDKPVQRMKICLHETTTSKPDDKILTEICSTSLPAPQVLQQHPGYNFSCDASSGKLFQRNDHVIAVYNVEAFTPRLEQILRPQRLSLESCFHISPGLLATAAEGWIDVLGIKYGSLQATRRMEIIRSRKQTPTSKERDSHASSCGQIQFVSYSRRHNLLVALIGPRLVQIPIATSMATSAQKRTAEGLLLGSLGRNLKPTFPRLLNAAATNQVEEDHRNVLEPTDPWYHRTNYLNKLFSNNDLDAFENAILEDLGLGQNPQVDSDPIKINYLLAKSFRIRESESGGLEDVELVIRFWSEKVHDQLIGLGLLSNERIQAALKSYGALSPTAKIASCAFIDSIIDHDPGLRILERVLGSSGPFTPLELSHSLLAIIRRIVAPSSPRNLKLITDGKLDTDAEPTRDTLVNGDIDQKDSSESQKNDSLHAKAAIDALHHVLPKLKRVPSRIVTQSLSQTFAASDLHGLIDILRVQLANNGWLALCADAPPDLPIRNTSEEQMNIISHILNSILDALGPAGWMLGNRTGMDLQDSDNTLTYLQAEISAALEGIEEAAYLQRVLHEMLICGKDSLEQPRKLLKDSGTAHGGSALIKPKAIALDRTSSLLPLGSRSLKKISKTKTGAGGELKFRSARDMGRMISRNVGPYSFERIEV